MLSKQQKAAAPREQPEGFVFPRTIGHHAHDIFLHAWHELGAAGALLLAIAGAAVVMLITLLPASAQPFAGGAFAAFALVGAFAWGMWQSCYYRFTCALRLRPVRHAEMHQSVLHHDIHLYTYLRQKLIKECRNRPRAECLAGKAWS